MAAWSAASFTGASMKDLRNRVDRRLNAVVKGLLNGQKLLVRGLLKVTWKLVSSSCVDYVINLVKSDLKNRNLYR